VKLLVDAQLPRRTVEWFQAAGHDAVHTLDMPRGNQSTDEEILRLAESEERIVVTKDADFVDSHTLKGRPAKLLLVSTGNVSNAALEALLVPLLSVIDTEFKSNNFLELGSAGLIVRG
jgi:predicted nuclease of predicted toxin-antitoxin system